MTAAPGEAPQTPREPARGAAFVRVEEVLLPRHDVAVAWRTVLAAPGNLARLPALARAAAALPLAAALGAGDRRAARGLGGLALAGLGVDRVEVLAGEQWDAWLRASVRPDGLRLVEHARAGGLALVLVSTGLRALVDPLARALAADALVAARLDARDGVATGRVHDGRDPGWLEALAAARGWSLAASWGYGTDLSDVELLEAVGSPCVVRPDLRLARRAAQAGWPTVGG